MWTVCLNDPSHFCCAIVRTNFQTLCEIWILANIIINFKYRFFHCLQYFFHFVFCTENVIISTWCSLFAFLYQNRKRKVNIGRQKHSKWIKCVYNAPYVSVDLDNSLHLCCLLENKMKKRFLLHILSISVVKGKFQFRNFLSFPLNSDGSAYVRFVCIYNITIISNSTSFTDLPDGFLWPCLHYDNLSGRCIANTHSIHTERMSKSLCGVRCGFPTQMFSHDWRAGFYNENKHNWNLFKFWYFSVFSLFAFATLSLLFDSGMATWIKVSAAYLFSSIQIKKGNHFEKRQTMIQAQIEYLHNNNKMYLNVNNYHRMQEWWSGKTFSAATHTHSQHLVI